MSSFPHDREATPDPVADIERGLSSLAAFFRQSNVAIVLRSNRALLEAAEIYREGRERFLSGFIRSM
jgi:hypothetical protein